MEKDLFIPELLTVILPYMEALYRVSPLPQNRAIAGLSMGGHQALSLVLRELLRFSSSRGLSLRAEGRTLVLALAVDPALPSPLP